MTHGIVSGKRLTAAELERLALPGKQIELVRGQLVVREPPGTRHGVISANLTYFMSEFVRRHSLGTVAAQDTGFKIGRDPDTVRAPDVAFIAAARSTQILARGYAELAPDLAAEVVSPDDSAADVLAKVADWLAAGTRLVWVIDPQRSEVRAYRPDGRLSIVGADNALDGDDVLPGFRCAVAQIFA